MGEVAGSTVASVASILAATATGDEVLVWVTMICNAAILVANCIVTIYRKWRDRDKDTAATPTEGNDDGQHDDDDSDAGDGKAE